MPRVKQPNTFELKNVTCGKISASLREANSAQTPKRKECLEKHPLWKSNIWAFPSPLNFHQNTHYPGNAIIIVQKPYRKAWRRNKHTDFSKTITIEITEEESRSTELANLRH